MAAALAKRQAGTHQDGVLRRTNLARDLYQIAELIELCFGSRLDSSGRAAVREMKTVGRLGPFLWLVNILDIAGLGFGRGYVWRAGGKVVGNVSLYAGDRHPWLGRGWLIANVAVHPLFQRRGIARALMSAAMDQAKRSGGHWVSLQVEAENAPAIALYGGLDFQTFETLSHWELDYFSPDASLPAQSPWQVRRRTSRETDAEIDLIFERARQGGMAWTQPLTRADLYDFSFGEVGALLEISSRQRWVLPDMVQPGRLVGSLWVELQGWRRARLTHFLDPSLADPQARRALMLHLLDHPSLVGRSLKLETVANDPPVDELLRSMGFRRVRTLVQMRYVLNEEPEDQ